MDPFPAGQLVCLSLPPVERAMNCLNATDNSRMQVHYFRCHSVYPAKTELNFTSVQSRIEIVMTPSRNNEHNMVEVKWELNDTSAKISNVLDDLACVFGMHFAALLGVAWTRGNCKHAAKTWLREFVFLTRAASFWLISFVARVSPHRDAVQ